MNQTLIAARRRLLLPALLACFAGGLLPATGLADASAVGAERLHGSPRHHAPRCAEGLAPFTRIELFFGLSRPGGVITEEDFKAFLDARVTPRFPDGLTLLSGLGQFRTAGGAIVAEGSKLLILLVPSGDAQAGDKVEAIRSDYRRQFQQESVLRADAAACVSF